MSTPPSAPRHSAALFDALEAVDAFIRSRRSGTGNEATATQPPPEQLLPAPPPAHRLTPLTETIPHPSSQPPALHGTQR